MNKYLTLKVHVENINLGQDQGQVHDLIVKVCVAYQSIRIVVLNTSRVFVLL